jgi:hypothetical protein
VLTDVLGVPIRGIHTDICAQTDERIIVFSLAGRPALMSCTAPTRSQQKGSANVVGNELTSPGHPRIIAE